MINIIELEKRWMRYKIKSYLPHFIIFMSLSVISLLGLIFFDTAITDTPLQEPSIIKKELTALDKNISVSPPVVPPKEIKKVQKTTLQQEHQLTLQPSFNFVKKLQDSQYTYVREVKKASHPKVIAKKVPAPKIAKVEAIQYKAVSKINIKREDSKQELQTIIQRFKRSNNPQLSLFIAKKYYKQKNYQQSYNYALITNKINNKIDESWIVFCKSLVRLGKKKFAIKILEDYTKETQSSTASILLSNIKSGKFR